MRKELEEVRFALPELDTRIDFSTRFMLGMEMVTVSLFLNPRSVGASFLPAATVVRLSDSLGTTEKEDVSGFLLVPPLPSTLWAPNAEDGMVPVPAALPSAFTLSVARATVVEPVVV